MKKISVYIVSGLGVDERVFQKLHFPDFVEVNFIPWEKPFPKESLDEYAERLLKKIDFSKPVVLVGLSFGGVVIQEIARRIKPAYTIIISSLSCFHEMPWYLRLYGNLRLYKITSFGILKRFPFLKNRIFGAYSSDDKKLLAQLIHDSDLQLVKWSVEKILEWRGEKLAEKFYHIHGDNDKLLPLKNKNVNAIIKGGGHFMVYNHAEEIEIILKEQLQKLL